MSVVIISRELYSPLSRVAALQSDLRTAPAYWPNLLSCVPDDPARPDRLTLRYKLGHHVVTASAEVERPDLQSVVVHLDGGIRGSVAADYAATAMTRTSVTLRLDVHFHRGPLGDAADWLFNDERIACDAATALDRLAELVGAETTDVLARVRQGIETSQNGTPDFGIRVGDADGSNSVRCSGPTLEGECSRVVVDRLACAGRYLVPAGEGVADGWALAVRQGACECPLLFVVPAVSLTA